MTSSKKTPVFTAKAPKPLPGMYNQAIVAGGVVYCSGSVAMDPETGNIVDGDIQVHTVILPRYYQREFISLC
jgi:enamine deaminase RidA (YjgF/YER057c/UK114 family)